MDGMIAVRTRSRNGWFHLFLPTLRTAPPFWALNKFLCSPDLGCWTCRARKVKCDEIRPKCSNCISRNIHCDYAPRPKSQRRRRTLQPEVEITASSSNTPQTSPLPPPTPRESIASSAISPGSSRPTPRLPAGLEAEKWPIPLSRVDCQAIRHYVEVIVPRTVLKTPQFSTYTSLLLLCTKHPLLAHLVLAFSVQDLAGSDKELNIIAIDHYQEALAMFIIHLGSSEQHLWVTFPALFLFIIYEQQYGDDPRAVQRHLEGVRDIVASHGSLILPAATGSSTTVNVEGEEYPRQLLDRLTLWTIYHDASASTFGYGGSLITLLDVQYPGSIARLRDSSESLTEVLWRADYPAEEELWDRQILPLEYLSHQYLLLRHRLSTCDVTHESLTNESLIFIGRELKRLEKVLCTCPAVKDQS